MEWREDRHFSGIKSSTGMPTIRKAGALLNQQQLAGIYLHTRFARLVVDRPADDATRRGWKIEVDDGEAGVDPFAEHLSRLDVQFKLREAMKTAGIYGGAGVVMILDDDGTMDEPLQGNVRGVKALHVFSRHELHPATWYEDIEHPKFGDPETYWLHPRKRHSAQVAPRVHADRVIRFPGLPIPDGAVVDYDGWGQSKIEAAFSSLVDINTATDSVREAIKQFQYGVLSLKNLQSILTGPDGDADNEQFRNRLEAIEEGKSTTRMIVIDAEDEYRNETSSFTGLIEAYRIKQQNLSATVRIPITILFGQSPSGLSTDDQSGTRNYYDGIAGDQEQYLAPALMQICKMLSIVHDELPADGYRVKFHALLTPSEKEEAEIRNIVADADSKNIDRGVYTADEARARYTAAGFSADIVISSDDVDDDADYQAMMEATRALRGKEAPEIVDKPGSVPEVEAEFDGAQVASMAEVISQVARGELPACGAVEILMLGFGISRNHAQRFFADKKIKEEATLDNDPKST